MGRAGEKKKQILDYLESYTASNGYPPSLREIGKAVGLSSTATVHAHLATLERDGLICRSGGTSRGISLRRGQGVPVLGVIRAGEPILAFEEPEGFVAYDTGGQAGDFFGLRVRGDSMINAGIHEGDVVVVRRQNHARSGQIVAALLEDEATVKRLFISDGHATLMPENPAYAPIPGDGAQILGVITALVREYD